MKKIEGAPTAPVLPATGSPTKHLEFRRGNSRVVADVAMSPRTTLARRRGLMTPQKYRAAQQQARKPSNPIGRPSSKPADNTAPKLAPSQPDLKPAEDDEWQDIDQPQPIERAPVLSPTTERKAEQPKAEPVKSESQGQRAFVLPQPRLEPHSQKPSPSEKPKPAPMQSEDESANSTSFLGFSPSATGASLLQKLGRRSSRLKRSLRGRWSDESSESQDTPREKRPWHSTSKQSAPQSNGAPTARSFWLDPSTPALLAMYLQVGFNLLMVSALLYAIFIFYVTIRNDVNMKVEEYSVDIIAEMSQCTQEYLRNNCELSRRVPALEKPCNEWEKCMGRDPDKVGRARVSAETFGSIVEAFLRPIGIKSMVFLVCVFAGSFLLINAVFASRIGPRFSAQYHNPYEYDGPRPHSAPRPESAQVFQQAPSYQQAQQQQHMPPQQIQYQPSPFIPFTPSRAHGSPITRQTPVHAALQSSPIHGHQMQPFLNYPY